MPASSYVAGKANSSTTAPSPKPSRSTPEPSRAWLAEKKPRAGSFQVGGSARQKLSILFPSHSASRRLPWAKPDAGLCWHWLRLRAASPREKRCSALSAGEAFQTRRSQPRNRILPPRRRTRAGDPQRAFRRKMSGNFAPASNASTNSPASCATKCKRGHQRRPLHSHVQENRRNRKARQANKKQSQRLAPGPDGSRNCGVADSAMPARTLAARRILVRNLDRANLIGQKTHFGG